VDTVKPKKPKDFSDKAETEQITRVAKKILGLKLGKIIRSGSEANAVGIQSEQILFSQRIDSRTYFVQDSKYGTIHKDGIFTGTDQEQIRLSRKIMRQLNIPLSEIAEEIVVEEHTQTAQVNKETGAVNKEEIKKGRKLTRISRQIDGFPVWSSNVVVGLNNKKQVGFMQLHWPEIPQHIVNEVHRLSYKMRHGWKPPEQPGATVESIEAGIIHSPALSFVMDIYPTIRAAYSPLDKSIGRKPVLYLDRNGKSVPIPRQFGELQMKEGQERKRPAEQVV
jgi:hypothetical protein